MESVDNKRYYTPKEIQSILGISKTVLYRIIKSNSFPVLTKKNRHYIPVEEFDMWCEKQGQKS